MPVNPGGSAFGAKQAAGFAAASAFGALARYRERGAGFTVIDIGGSAPDTPERDRNVTACASAPAR
jgi:hypothetical protein